MRRLGRRLWIVAAVPLVASVVTAAYAFGWSGAPSTERDALGPGLVTVTLDVEHSRFEPARIVVRQHTAVRFRVVNHDPIGHELIVGDDDVHARHESGTHGTHGARPRRPRTSSTRPEPCSSRATFRDTSPTGWSAM